MAIEANDQKVRRLVDGARERPVDERLDWLRDACAGDADLLSAALTELNALPRRDDSIVDTTLRGETSDFLDQDPIGASGLTIGGFRVRQPIGEGGFGIVYLATDEEGRHVAIKVARRPGAPPRLVERFETGLRLLQELRHPGISRYFGAGATEEGRLWIAIEFVNGPALDRYADRVDLGLSDRLGLFRDVCLSVEYLHEHGIVHRDLKPSNILVSTEASGPRPKLIDFGVARGMATEFHELDDTLEIGGLSGTPAYMPPEQADPAFHDRDIRVDVAALGAILGEQLVGEPPVDRRLLLEEMPVTELGERVRDAPRRNLIDIIDSMDEKRLEQVASQRRTTPTGLREAISGDLAAIVARAVEADPALRYQSMREFIDDIERYRRGDPVRARSSGSSNAASRFVVRRFATTLAMVLMLAALAGGLVIAATGWRSALNAIADREAALADREVVLEQLRAREQIVVELLRAGDLDQSERGSATTSVEFLTRAADALDGRFGGDARGEVRIRLALGEALASLDAIEPARKQLLVALERADEAFGVDDPDAIRCLGAVAELRRRAGLLGPALESGGAAYERAKASPLVADAEREELTREVGFRLLHILHASGGFVEGIALADALESGLGSIDEVAGAPITDARASIDFYRALHHNALGQAAQAAASARRNLAHNELVRPTHWWTAESRSVLAEAETRLGRLDVATELLREAEPVLESALEDDAEPVQLHRRRVLTLLEGLIERDGTLSAQHAVWRADTRRRIDPIVSDDALVHTLGRFAPDRP